MSAQNNNPRGIVLVIIAMSLFAMQDALIKFVFEKTALYEILFGRYIVRGVKRARQAAAQTPQTSDLPGVPAPHVLDFVCYECGRDFPDRRSHATHMQAQHGWRHEARKYAAATNGMYA